MVGGDGGSFSLRLILVRFGEAERCVGERFLGLGVRIGEEEAARQSRPRVAAVASHESAVYLDPKSNQWSHNSRLVVATATTTSPTASTVSAQSTQTGTPVVTRGSEGTKGGQAVIVSHPQPQNASDENQVESSRQQGNHLSHPPPVPPQHVTPSMGTLPMTPPPHWFYDSRLLSQSTLERLDPAASTSSPRAPQRVPHENGVTVWSGLGCDPSVRRRPLSQPSCYGPCNRHHNAQMLHSQPHPQMQHHHYHQNMQAAHLQTAVPPNNHQHQIQQHQMHHPHAHHHLVMPLPHPKQETSGEMQQNPQQTQQQMVPQQQQMISQQQQMVPQQQQQTHQQQVHLPEIPEFCHSGSQYASSGVLDEVSGAREYDVVGGGGPPGNDGINGTETSTLKTRSLPAWVRSRSRPLSTEDDLAELYAKVTVWSGLGCDPSVRRRPLSQPSCYGPCNRHHNAQMLHSQPHPQMQHHHYHQNMQAAHLQTAVPPNNHQHQIQQHQMHHPHAHHHLVMPLPHPKQETSGEMQQNPQQTQQQMVNLSKKRKNRMRSDEAAIIALSKSRSQFLPIPPCHSHHTASPSTSSIASQIPVSSSIAHRCHRDTDSLVDHEAVIVYDERTAL
ncbi:hypothetical protein J437_LFUL012987 [Ladona fulva]|uniref:Uncharacterized protein n=1 Tax=Ladona fulva TaxID=123851 RepID=A0A8K0KD22_LADFU|nr:hypothetical protein J437_LFUL012987 [Ladona fulva]